MALNIRQIVADIKVTVLELNDLVKSYRREEFDGWQQLL